MSIPMFETACIENNENGNKELIDFVDCYDNHIPLSRVMCLLAQEVLRTKRSDIFDGCYYMTDEELEDVFTELYSGTIRRGNPDSSIKFTKNLDEGTITINLYIVVYGDEAYYEEDTNYREYEVLGEDEFNITIPYELFMNYQF